MLAEIKKLEINLNRHSDESQDLRFSDINNDSESSSE
jgi:hypothetical protein